MRGALNEGQEAWLAGLKGSARYEVSPSDSRLNSIKGARPSPFFIGHDISKSSLVASHSLQRHILMRTSVCSVIFSVLLARGFVAAQNGTRGLIGNGKEISVLARTPSDTLVTQLPSITTLTG